jgi:hypothetical protein
MIIIKEKSLMALKLTFSRFSHSQPRYSLKSAIEKTECLEIRLTKRSHISRTDKKKYLMLDEP